MSTWQVARVGEQGRKSYITGALMYEEALRKVNALVRTEDSHKKNFSIDIFMPQNVVVSEQAAPAQEEQPSIRVAEGDAVKFMLGSTPMIGVVQFAVTPQACTVRLNSGAEIIVSLDSITDNFSSN